MDIPIIDKVIAQMKNLPQELQWRVWEYTRTLTQSTPQGISGAQLLRFAGFIPREDVRVMKETIEEGCEQVDGNEW